MEDYLYGLLGLYKKMPIQCQQVIGWLYNMLPHRIRYGSFYDQYNARIKTWENGQFVQEQLLAETRNYAVEHVPFYAHSKDNTSDFSVITKQIISDNKKAFLNEEHSHLRLKSNTGGTSGSPFEFYIHKGVGRAKEKAHFDWYWRHFGYKIGDKILMIRGAPLKNNALYEYIAIDNKLSVTCYGLNDINISSALAAIKRFKPKFIHGYPSAVKIVTALLDKQAATITTVKGLFLGSEYLADQDRTYFESFYSARVANWYGHSELLIHAGNCQYSNEYHIYPFYGYAELIDKDGLITEPNKIGKIIATGFDNKVMPLLRYDTGDLAEYADSTSCQCGFKGRSFSRIYGREQNYIVLNDLTKVSVTAFIFGQHFSEFGKIREIQLVQENSQKLLVHIVPNAAFSTSDMNSLKQKMSNSVNDKIDITIVLVQKTEKTASGKHKILIQAPGLISE